MKKYIMPNCTLIALANERELLSLSGVKSNGIDFGGVDFGGTIDPAAKRVNPFYKDGDDVLEEEE